MTGTDAIVARIMRIRNGMTVDADAKALIRREIDALCGRTSPVSESVTDEDLTRLYRCTWTLHGGMPFTQFCNLRKSLLETSGHAQRSKAADETGMSKHLREIIGQETTPPLWIYVTKEQIPILEAIADRLDWLENLYAPFITEHPPQPAVSDTSTLCKSENGK